MKFNSLLEDIILLDRYLQNDEYRLYVSYSGGLDSTVLTDLLLKYCKSNGKSLTIVSVYSNILPYTQQIAERIKREQFTGYVNDNYPDIANFVTIRYNSNTRFKFNKCSNMNHDVDQSFRLPQQCLILTQMAIESYFDDHVNLFAAYVKGDDFCNKNYEHKKYIKSLGELFGVSMQLSTPLIYTDKFIVYKYAVDNNLIDYITWCEHPTVNEDKNEIIPCNNCQSCIHHNIAVKNYFYLCTDNEKNVDDM